MERRSSRLAIIMAGCVLAGCPANAWGFKARIDRPVVQEVVAPGRTISGTIQVDNEEEKPVQVEVYLQDWEYLEGGSGDKLFSAPGSSSWSASSWINFHPQRLELPPRGRGLVEYTIRVPLEATGGHYAVMFFESLLAAAPSQESGVTVQYTGRIGSLFEIEADGTVERTGAITDVTIGRPDEDRPLILGYAFLNTGNVAIRPKGYFNIVDRAGGYLGRGEFSPLYTFPGRSGSTTAEWAGGLPSGEYTVLLTVDLGNQVVLVREEALAVGRQLMVEGVAVLTGEPFRGGVTVHNAGNFQAETGGTLRVETVSGALVAGGVPIRKTLLAPGERRRLPFGAPRAVGPGSYRCRVELVAGDLRTERVLPCVVE